MKVSVPTDTMPASALVVAVDGILRQEYCRVLAGAGLEVAAAESFQEARARLAAHPPDVLVASLALREYNGIHLALLGREVSPSMRVIIAGYPDAALEAEAAATGAVYLADSAPASLLAVIGAPLPRRFARKLVADGVRGQLGDAVVRLLDVSYGGFRVEGADGGTIGESLELRLLDAGIAAAARRVWLRAGETAGTWLCGAAVSPAAQDPGSDWRAFVDSVGEPATTG